MTQSLYFRTNLKLWSDRVQKEKKLREKLDLMSKLNDQSFDSTQNMGTAKPVTRNRLERTKSLKH